MERLFIDESGTMTVTYCDIHPYFVVAIVPAKNPEKLYDNTARAFNYFIRLALEYYIKQGYM